MKATGIVRRVDDLGRIVIPKEIRRTLKIREGAPFRITFTRNNSSGQSRISTYDENQEDYANNNSGVKIHSAE